MGWSAMGAAAAAGLAGAVLALRCRAAAAHSADQLLELRRQLEAERLAHEATERKRKQEKAGRSKAERDKRSALKESDASSSGVEFPLAPIGTVASCFLDCAATPRQPGLCPDALIKLEFDKRLSPEIFEGLFPEHSHVWIIYIFHKNTNPDRTIAHLETGKTFPAKIQPPRRRGKAVPRIGVLGTRTPHRPNPIGLSLGRIISIDAKKRLITVGGTDLVDGTPILDIKPYLPNFDSRPISQELTPPQWLERSEPAVCPQWSLDADEPRLVVLTDEAERAWWKAAKHLRLYKKDAERGLVALKQVLATDCNRRPRPALPYVMRWDGVVVSYVIVDDDKRTTTVCAVGPDTAHDDAGRWELDRLAAAATGGEPRGKPQQQEQGT
jgi:tRNA-Thr(GGU) m(6)t(6)A37 methyltransferase TsaA